MHTPSSTPLSLSQCLRLPPTYLKSSHSEQVWCRHVRERTTMQREKVLGSRAHGACATGSGPHKDKAHMQPTRQAQTDCNRPSKAGE